MSLADSIRQRLLNLAHKKAEPFDLVLTRYGLERLLYRIGKSKWKKNFLLKGAMLFSLWYDSPHRPTRDLDLMIYGKADAGYLKAVFQSICTMNVENDGIEYVAETVTCSEIREKNIYHGIRVKLMATLAGARLRLQIDIGFGDAVVPEPEEITYPTLLELPAPRVRSYSMYTVVAEKFQAMVTLGIFNSRLKDFFDIRVMAGEFKFSGAVLCSAIESTFKRRDSDLPLKTPIALTNSFAVDRFKRIQWDAFIRKNRLHTEEKSLVDIVDFLHSFLMPPVSSLTSKRDFNSIWQPGGPWKSLGGSPKE
ncbi:MAG: nucleotidyl transferase AbiEii/AbiGii toxin family protein [bacterium]|nr:nucleotidyl transferase AbiEii/AbiGii toxin family protein [bacterium]